MSLTLYFHPFASFCQKALIALYENETPFSGLLVDLANQESRAAFLRVWPIGKFPVLRDDARACTIPESSIIIEYLAQYYPGPSVLVPSDPDQAWQTRLWDRFYDLHVSEPMQKIVGDRLRAPGKADRTGVDLAKAALETAYGVIDAQLSAGNWATGEQFCMADCAAAPALYYADLVLPIEEKHARVRAYLNRLLARPSFARVLQEAEPYKHLFPSAR